MNTPRLITDSNGNTVWQNDPDEPFGNTVPNQSPNGGSSFQFNLRFAGQYADVETGTYYNYHRDYDPTTGRYLESDPLGLFGGQFSTYSYVGDSPLNRVDPTGLAWACRWAGLVVICSNSDPTLPPGYDPQTDSFSSTPGSSAGNFDPCKMFPSLPGCQNNSQANNQTKNGQDHHICTDKNNVSTARGGPWTPRFKAIFDKAGMDLSDPLNRVNLPDHYGPHPEAYHQYVENFLLGETEGLEGAEYKQALQDGLRQLQKDILNPNSQLNKWLTK